MNQKISIPAMVGGGTPSCMTFYKNPQYLISIDKEKFKNPAHVNKFFDIQVTYKTKDENTSFKLFLCHAAKGVMRVSEVNECMVNKALKDDPYRSAFYTQRFTIHGTQFYSLVISSFKPGQNLAGELEVESNDAV